MGLNEFNLYPNPSKGIFYISFSSMYLQDLKITILNSIGEVIYTEDLVKFQGNYKYSFNLNQYSKGIYFLEIDSENGKLNKKLILH